MNSNMRIPDECKKLEVRFVFFQPYWWGEPFYDSELGERTNRLQNEWNKGVTEFPATTDYWHPDPFKGHLKNLIVIADIDDIEHWIVARETSDSTQRIRLPKKKL